MKVGYILTEKKKKQMDWHEFVAHVQSAGDEIVEITDLEAQGPFTVVIHKLLYEMLDKDTDPAARARLEAFIAYRNAHPDMAVVDPLDNIEVLNDRASMYAALDRALEGTSGPLAKVRAASFGVLHPGDDLDELFAAKRLQFPVVCKTLPSCGASSTHVMSIVFDAAMLEATVTRPCVVQNWVNHGALIYKLYVLGDNVSVVRRASMRDVQPGGTEPVTFDSQAGNDKASSTMEHSFPPDVADAIGTLIRDKMGVTLFGADVIINSATGEYVLIDINYFPGYKGVEQRWQTMHRHLKHMVAQHAAARK